MKSEANVKIKFRSEGSKKVEKDLESISKRLQELSKSNAALRKNISTLKGRITHQRNSLRTLRTGLRRTGKSFKETGDSAYNFSGKLFRTYLPLLFFFQNIKRMFEGLARWASNSFLKVMQGTDEMVRNTNPAYTAISALRAEMSYLGFVIGQAFGTTLKSVLPNIIKLVEKVSEFVGKHPKLVSMAIAFSIVAASLEVLKADIMLVVGALKSTIAISAISSFANPWVLAIALVTAAISYLVWWILNAKKKLGSWKEVLKALAVMFLQTFTGWIPTAKVLFIEFSKWIAGKLLVILNFLNRVISTMNSLLHTHIPTIDTSGVKRFYDEYKNLSFATLMKKETEGYSKFLQRMMGMKHTFTGNIANPKNWKVEGLPSSENVLSQASLLRPPQTIPTPVSQTINQIVVTTTDQIRNAVNNPLASSLLNPSDFHTNNFTGFGG